MCLETEKMNLIDFKIVTIDESIVDGIPLKNCLLIELILNGHETSKIHFFEDSYVIADQLYAAKDISGEFYLLSGISGILEEDGWECPANVLHMDSLVKWDLNRGGQVMSLVFEKNSYAAKIESLKEEIARIGRPVEPAKIFFS
jgi:hypothetical protein